ncbi:hypothetical protein LUZ60_011035 [Juncus effusus]|nr:hypothetical protein LUZ60_011035 [Juncus effusus]
MASRNQEENLQLNLQQVINELQRGQDSANWLESVIQNRTGSNAQNLVEDIKGCFSRALTALDSSNQVSNQLQLPPVSGFRSRNEADTRTKILHESSEDCYSWRKYRSKQIPGFKYPRCDFVCIHKEDLNCRATKRVQRLEGDTLMYEIIYNGEHTCINLFNQQNQQNSSFVNRHEMASSSSGFLSPEMSLDVEHERDTFDGNDT